MTKLGNRNIPSRAASAFIVKNCGGKVNRAISDSAAQAGISRLRLGKSLAAGKIDKKIFAGKKANELPEFYSRFCGQLFWVEFNFPKPRFFANHGASKIVAGTEPGLVFLVKAFNLAVENHRTMQSNFIHKQACCCCCLCPLPADWATTLSTSWMV